MPRVFVTGGTGFVGRHVIRALLARGFLVRCLVRPGSEAALRGFEALERVPGDVLNPDRLVESVEGCTAVVHLVGIIREHRARGITFERLHGQATEMMLAAARDAGVTRYLQMSALGTRPDARAAYHRSKWAAEEAVRASRLDWTIFRPSVIYGRGDAFITMLARMVRRLPAVPVLGSGRYRLQPVAVEHVAAVFARALLSRTAVGQTCEVAGPRAYTFVELLEEIGQALGRSRVRKVHIPLPFVRALTAGLGWLPLWPVTRDQLLMLEEDNVVDPEGSGVDFGLEPESLAAGLARVLAEP